MVWNKVYKVVIIGMMAAIYLLPSYCLAQHKIRTAEMFAGLYGREDTENTFYYAGITYTWWLNKYLGISTGGMLGMSKIDKAWSLNGKDYYLSDNTYSLNAVEEVKLALPIYKGFGAFGEGQFIFEPIPFYYISMEERTPTKTENKGKYLFTKFNPGGIVNCGLYYEATRADIKIRFMLGYGRGYFDALNSYRISTIDGQRLSEHIPSRAPVTNIFIKISVFQ